jgi:hypothetical protein
MNCENCGEIITNATPDSKHCNKCLESQKTANIANFTRISLPLLRKSFSKLIIDKFR